MSWRGASGERAEVAVHIFETDFAREHNRPLVSLEGAHAERGDRLLVVAVQDAGEIDQEASQELLAAILSRAADPGEPIAAMTLPESSWLRPRTAVVDTSLVIAPDLIETATKALEAEGYENVSMRTSQRVDTTNPNDHGHPGHEIAGTTADGAQARVGFRCVGADLDSHFWPTPQEAELGEAIAVVAHCKVVVGVRVDSNTGADLSSSKALFEAMAGFESPPEETGWPWTVWAAIGAGIVVLALLCTWWLWRVLKGAVKMPEARPDPPHVIALREWAQANSDRREGSLDDAGLALELSRVLRVYLEAICAWPATARWSGRSRTTAGTRRAPPTCSSGSRTGAGRRSRSCWRTTAWRAIASATPWRWMAAARWSGRTGTTTPAGAKRAPPMSSAAAPIPSTSRPSPP